MGKRSSAPWKPCDTYLWWSQRYRGHTTMQGPMPPERHSWSVGQYHSACSTMSALQVCLVSTVRTRCSDGPVYTWPNIIWTPRHLFTRRLALPLVRTGQSAPECYDIQLAVTLARADACCSAGHSGPSIPDERCRRGAERQLDHPDHGPTTSAGDGMGCCFGASTMPAQAPSAHLLVKVALPFPD